MVGSTPDVRRFTIERDVDPVRGIEVERIEWAVECVGILPSDDLAVCTPINDFVATINTCTVGALPSRVLVRTSAAMLG